MTSDPATNTGGVVNIYRKGYHRTDDDNGDPNVMPYKSVRLVDSTAAAVKTLFTPGNKNAEHTLRIQGNASVMTYSIDGVALTGFTGSTMTIGAGRPAQNNNLNVTPNSTIDAAGVHTFRTGNNFNTFPHLGEIGFSVKNVGDDVTVTDYKLVDVAQSSKRTLFDSTTPTNYGIFSALANSGITTTGNTIRVRPDGRGPARPEVRRPEPHRPDPGAFGVPPQHEQGHRQGPPVRHRAGRLRDVHQRRPGQRGLPEPGHVHLREDPQLQHL